MTYRSPDAAAILMECGCRIPHKNRVPNHCGTKNEGILSGVI
jgi:hypothetical protein